MNLKGNVSRLMQLLLKHGRQKEALEFMCASLEKKRNENDILLTWGYVDALLSLVNEENHPSSDTLDKDIIKARNRLKALASDLVSK